MLGLTQASDPRSPGRDRAPYAAGLSQHEADARLRRDGYNELPQTTRRTLFRIALEVGREPMLQLLVATGVTLAMSMLPEGFPSILTVFMVIGAWRISQQRVLTRRSATIETLGAATAEARAVGFVALVIANFGLIVVNRSFAASIVSALVRPNRAFWLMLAATSALLAAALLIAPVRALFHFGPAHAGTIGAAIGVGIAVLVALALLKTLGFGSVIASPDAAASG
jgi:magnesium-transporting ATPase (P-type)